MHYPYTDNFALFAVLIFNDHSLKKNGTQLSKAVLHNGVPYIQTSDLF